jgi:hypothetical protein
MMDAANPGKDVLIQADPELAARVESLARHARAIFVAGLPGTGKSLLIHQIAHLAHRAGRSLHLLQWDVARPVFEASPAGQRYPMVDGVTHVAIRSAVGAWARQAVAAWDRRCAEPANLLVGEAPLVGGRLIELGRPAVDDAEAVLSGASCRFVIPVPSRDVRRYLEAERDRRAKRPLHEREREDAPPHVLRDLWHALVEVAAQLGLADAERSTPYDPGLYRGVYEALLRARHVEALPMNTVLATAAMSVYDLTTPHADLVPTPDETDRFIRDVEQRCPDMRVLERQMERWWIG